MGDAAFKSPVAYDYISAERIRCRNDSVLIRWEEGPEMTAGGIVIPRNTRTKAIEGRIGIVVSCGPGPSYSSKCPTCEKPRSPYGMEVNPGDRVIADGQQPGELVYVNGVEHRMVREAELLAVLG